jgi:hypothetical protein
MVTIPRSTRQVSSAAFNVPAAARAPFLDLDGGAPGRALAALGGNAQDVAIGFLERRLAARRTADLTAAQAAAARALADLELDIEQDPDFRGRPARFTREAGAIRDRTAQGLDHAPSRGTFTRDFDTLALSKETEIKRSAFKREVDATVAGLDAITPEIARQAAAARSVPERGQLVDQGRLAIAGMVEAGFITARDGVARDQEFLSSIDEAQLRTLLTEDPEAAELALTDETNFTNLSAAGRARLNDTVSRRAESARAERARQAEAAERKAEKARQDRGEALLTEAYRRHADGTLDRAAADDIRSEISPAEYKGLLTLLDPASGAVTDDPGAIADLVVLLGEDPRQVASRAAQYHRAGLLSNDRYISMIEKARTVGRQEGPQSGYERSRDFLRASLDPGPGVPDPVGRQRTAEALDAFDTYALSGNRSDADLAARAKELRNQFSLVNLSEERILLPNPRFGTIPRQGDEKQIRAALEAARRATLAKRKAGQLDDAELLAEMDIFDRWTAWLGRQAAAPEGDQ